jgi:hypothetical protein
MQEPVFPFCTDDFHTTVFGSAIWIQEKCPTLPEHKPLFINGLGRLLAGTAGSSWCRMVYKLLLVQGRKNIGVGNAPPGSLSVVS